MAKSLKSNEHPLSEKNYMVTLVLCLLLGMLGAHRFYVGKIGTGLLMLITFGGFGIWFIIDLILIAMVRFTDDEGYFIEP